jgi:hypothetical protein
MLRLLNILLLAAALMSAAESKSVLETDAKGWKDLTTLQGWTRLPLPTTVKLNPENQWKFDKKTRTLICEGDKGHEILRSDATYKDFIFHVEWRFKKVEADPQPRYNSGVFVRTSDDGDFMTQAQVGPGPNVWLFADYPVEGKKQRVNLRDQMTAQRTRPPGEWNTFELTAQGPKVSLWVNGETIGAIEPVGLLEGHVGLEAEGFYIEFRNVKIKPLK